MTGVLSRMMTLDRDQKEFFRLVSRAISANPFGAERQDLDLALSGISGDVSRAERLAAAVAAVSARITPMKEAGRADIRQYEGEDHTLMEHALLFDFFHCRAQDFDRFIQDQAVRNATSLKLPFGAAALAELEEYGFDPAAARRYLALCFQLRRAFYFIATALAGRSACMVRLRETLWNNVFTGNLDFYHRFLQDRMEDFATLVLGETGTGKGTAAKAIGRSGFIPYDGSRHCFSESFQAAFTTVNLSEYPDTLIESELFGHKKGAFTGAVDHFKGVFDRCSPCGSIFLDEIGEVSQGIQIKLLRVMQERGFSPVGSHEERRFSGRIIAAANRPLAELLQSGRMRADFYYRLCSDVIVVPPLRRRLREDPDELQDLLGVVLKRIFGASTSDIPDMTANMAAAIQESPGPEYDWPGNVRELEQCVRRILLNGSYTPDLAREDPDLAERLKQGIDAGSLDARSLMADYCLLLYRRHGTYEAVSRRTGLDRRTVKRHIEIGAGNAEQAETAHVPA